MAARKKVLAICGSTKKTSLNLSLIKAIAALPDTHFDIDIFDDIAGIPHFNPDIDTAPPPEAVTAFRNRLRAADGILICTPEYAMGVPGSLKNAIDWTVSSCEFSHKSTALITASSVGEKGHKSLMETLRIIESAITDATQLIIPFVKTKVSPDGVITDPQTQQAVIAVLHALEAGMDNADNTA